MLLDDWEECEQLADLRQYRSTAVLRAAAGAKQRMEPGDLYPSLRKLETEDPDDDLLDTEEGMQIFRQQLIGIFKKS